MVAHRPGRPVKWSRCRAIAIVLGQPPRRPWVDRWPKRQNHRANDKGLQAWPVGRVAPQIRDPVRITISKDLQTIDVTKIEQERWSLPNVLVQANAVGLREIGSAASYEGMVASQIIAQRHARDAISKIGRGIRGGGQVAAASAPPARAIEDMLGDRPPLALIAVEKPGGGIAGDRRGELPTEVHRIVRSEVEALAAQRRVDVRGVTS